MSGVRFWALGAWCLTLGACGLPRAAAAGPLDARLTFSQDGGKTWSGDFPTVASGAVLRVRAAYSIADAWEKRDVITANISCAEPFASRTQVLKGGGYMQRHPVYWKTSRVNGDYVWNLDTGGLSPGAHVFWLEIGYWRQDEQGKGCERICDSQPFYLKVIVPPAGAVRRSDAPRGS